MTLSTPSMLSRVVDWIRLSREQAEKKSEDTSALESIALIQHPPLLYIHREEREITDHAR